MDDFAERLDLAAASAELDALLAAFAANHQPYPWLRAALEAARSLPAADMSEASGWTGMRVGEGPTQVVYAYRADVPETGVRGDWQAGRLTSAQASLGGRFWILREDGESTVTWSTDAGEDASTEQTRARAVEGRVARGVHAALPNLGALPGWACPACGWHNNKSRPNCELCEAPRSGAAKARPVTPASALPDARQSQTLELPDALKGLVEQALDPFHEAAQNRGAVRSPAPPAPAPPPEPPFLMLIDAVFEIPGHGVLASGVVRRGRLRGGEPLDLVGSVVRPTRARTLERDRRAAPEANPGEIIGVVLDGVRRADLAPGMVLAAPGSIQPGLEFEAQVTPVAGPPPAPGRVYQVLVWSIAVNGWIAAINGYTPSNALAIRIRLTQPVPLEAGLGVALRENGVVVATGQVTLSW